MAKASTCSGFGFSKYRAPAIAFEEPEPLVTPLEKRFVHTRESGIETIRYAYSKPSRRRIHGIASTPTINEHKYSLSSKGCSVRFPIPILSKHAKHGGPIGEVTLVRKSDAQIFIEASIYENEAGDYAWRLIENGTLRGLSGSAAEGAHLQAQVEGISFYDVWRLKEVSLCKKGANPDCTFEIMA